METTVLIKGVFQQVERVEESVKTSSKGQLQLSFGGHMKKSCGGTFWGLRWLKAGGLNFKAGGIALPKFQGR